MFAGSYVKKFALVLAVGLAVRYVLAVLFTYPTDINYWMIVCQNIASGESLYSLPGYYYTPIWGYVLSGVTVFLQFAGIPFGEYAPGYIPDWGMSQDWNSVIPSLGFALTMKTVLIIIDVLVMVFLYKIVKLVSDERKAFLVASFWFLCPFTILISSVRVMFENLEVLMLVIALYAILMRRPAEAGVAMALSLLVKPYGIFFAILMIGFAYAQSKSAAYTLKYVLSVAVAGVVAMIPVFLEGDFAEAMTWLSNQTPGQTAASSYNFVMYITPALLIIALFLSAVFAKTGMDDFKGLMAVGLMLTAGMLVIPGNIQYYLVLLPLVLLVPMRHQNLVLLLFIVLSVCAFMVYNDWST